MNAIKALPVAKQGAKYRPQIATKMGSFGGFDGFCQYSCNTLKTIMLITIRTLKS